jgi:hypothetical protein
MRQYKWTRRPPGLQSHRGSVRGASGAGFDGLDATLKLGAGHHGAPLAAEAFEADVAAEAVYPPSSATAGVGLFKGEDVVDMEV